MCSGARWRGMLSIAILRRNGYCISATHAPVADSRCSELLGRSIKRAVHHIAARRACYIGMS